MNIIKWKILFKELEMQTDKSIEREVQDKFFDIITNQKKTIQNAFKVYQN